MSVFGFGRSREYKSFVAHRVGKIHDRSNPDQWRYVPSQLNPADFGTRGMTARELAESKKWWNRTELLRRPEAEWPICKFDKPSREAMIELKPTSRENNENSSNCHAVQLLTNERGAETDKSEGVD